MVMDPGPIQEATVEVDIGVGVASIGTMASESVNRQLPYFVMQWGFCRQTVIFIKLT
jgi:hypothetical protein